MNQQEIEIAIVLMNSLLAAYTITSSSSTNVYPCESSQPTYPCVPLSSKKVFISDQCVYPCESSWPTYPCVPLSTKKCSSLTNVYLCKSSQPTYPCVPLSSKKCSSSTNVYSCKSSLPTYPCVPKKCSSSTNVYPCKSSQPTYQCVPLSMQCIHSWWPLQILANIYLGRDQGPALSTLTAFSCRNQQGVPVDLGLYQIMVQESRSQWTLILSWKLCEPQLWTWYSPSPSLALCSQPVIVSQWSIIVFYMRDYTWCSEVLKNKPDKMRTKNVYQKCVPMQTDLENLNRFNFQPY